MEGRRKKGEWEEERGGRYEEEIEEETEDWSKHRARKKEYNYNSYSQ